MVEIFFQTSIVTIYFDGGGEYQCLKGIFESHGIQHLVSPPYTPQHIASVECRHQHIVETGLSFLHKASLPLSFWPHAFQTAVYLINRLPTPFLHNKSPFENLFHNPSNYSKLRVFWCLCYPWLHHYTHHKLEPRSKPCTFLGYSNLHNAYKCFDSSTNKNFYFKAC